MNPLRWIGTQWHKGPGGKMVAAASSAGLALAAFMALSLAVGLAIDDNGTPVEPIAESAAGEPVAEEAVDTEVEIELEAGREGDVLLLEGSATVPDGALLAYEVSASLEDPIVEGHAEVQGGRFSESVDVSELPDVPLEVWLGFQTILGQTVEQPPAVLELYGDDGARMTGPQVETSGGLTRATIVETVAP